MNPAYVRIREIGRGGMATVYLGRRLADQRLVAIKILNREIAGDREYVRRFFREASLMARLHHPNIVEVLESHYEGGEGTIVTEYVDGGDLRRVLLEGHLSLPQLLAIMERVVAALDHAHGQGVVHRDIKPSNILLTRAFEPKVCDFGIATALWGQNTQLTRTDEVLGTMDYIAPEQRESARTVDGRADLYSIGVILYQLITGRKPAGAFSPPREVVAGIAAPLSHLVMKCLAPSPEDRFRSAATLRGELQAVLAAGAVVSPGSETPAGRSQEPEGATVAGVPPFSALLMDLRDGSLTRRITVRGRVLASAGAEDGPALMTLLETDDPFLRETGAEALGKLRYLPACSRLIALLGDPFVFKAAAASLGELGCAEAEKPLLAMVSRVNERSPAALIPLARMGVRRALPHIARHLKSEFSWIRETALEALELLGGNDCRRLIEAVAQGDAAPEVRAKAKKILWRWNP